MRCIGYPELYRHKSPMGFDLLSAEQPGEYKLSTWALSDREILEELPRLMKRGNCLYHRGKFDDAAYAYLKALDSLELMSFKVGPHSALWKILQEMKVPLQLNYTECKFCLCEYNEVVTHTTAVIEFDQDNARALFQRAEAHLLLHNLVQARRDYEKVIMLNSPLAEVAEDQLAKLKKAVQAVLVEQKERLME